MYTIGIDQYKRERQLCIHVEGSPFIELGIATTRERFAAALPPYAPARVLLEASTESEWVAYYLESLGHTVIVADPNFAPMYATRSRRVKTDKRDARTLCEACACGSNGGTSRNAVIRAHDGYSSKPRGTPIRRFKRHASTLHLWRRLRNDCPTTVNDRVKFPRCDRLKFPTPVNLTPQKEG